MPAAMAGAVIAGGRTQGKIGFHAGKVAIERPRVRDLGGRELALPSWDRAVAEDWLGKWAMSLMLINVSTRKFRRAVRLPEGDVPAPAGSGVSKSAVPIIFSMMLVQARERRVSKSKTRRSATSFR